MGMKGKFENIKSRMNKQAATDEAFVQFCNNEVNLRRAKPTSMKTLGPMAKQR